MADDWYCLILGAELGPMPWDELVLLAERGNLQPQHQVRQGESGAWAPAHGIAGLFSSAPGAAGRSALAWYCEVFGAELGPMPWDDLRAMAERGTLGANGHVRHEGADWVAAESVAGLLPKARLQGAATPRSSVHASQPAGHSDDDFETDARTAMPSLPDADTGFETDVAPKPGAGDATVSGSQPAAALISPASSGAHSGPKPAAGELKKRQREPKPPRASFHAPSIPPGALKVLALAVAVVGIGCAVYFGGGQFGGNNYGVVVDGFDSLYQDVERLHEQSQDPMKLGGVNQQFAVRFASVRRRLKVVDPGTVGEKLHQAGEKLAEMQANAVGGPGSPEEKRFQRAEQEFKALLDAARQQLGQ